MNNLVRTNRLGILGPEGWVSGEREEREKEVGERGDKTLLPTFHFAWMLFGKTIR